MSQNLFSVAVEPQYLPDQSDPAQAIYTFSYTITVTNTGQVPAQLMARHWSIRDANGQLEEVKGLGVVGQQPLLRPGESFQYTSGCRLRTASGSMEGRYFCMTEDAQAFDAPIATFVLDANVASAPASSAGQVLH